MCLCDPSWLEPSPGTFSIGLQRILGRRRKFYGLGPLVSDAQFPIPTELAHRRLLENKRTLMESNFGFSFYDGIDATALLQSFHDTYGSFSQYVTFEKLGLIIAEHIWPRQVGDRITFLVKVVNSFLSQFSSVPKIIVMRDSDWEWVERALPAGIRRLEVVHGSDFQPHYEPLRHNWEQLERDVIRSPEVAIIIHPIGARLKYSTPLHIPHLVLSAMFESKRTLWCAAGTLESQVSALEWFLLQLRRHNIAPP